MKLNENVYVLEIENDYMTYYPVLIKDNSKQILIDTGFSKDIPILRQAIEAEGLSFESITEVILTHQDGDHIDGANKIKDLIVDCIFSSHEEERKFIQGDYLPFKAVRGLVSSDNQLTEEQKQIKSKFDPMCIKIDKTYKDKDKIDLAGGVSIIHTPGHTPGHICLYLDSYGIVIAGDGLNAENGVLSGPNPKYTFDMDLAYQSLTKLQNKKIETIICYHGGMVTDNPKEALDTLINMNTK